MTSLNTSLIAPSSSGVEAETDPTCEKELEFDRSKVNVDGSAMERVEPSSSGTTPPAPRVLG